MRNVKRISKVFAAVVIAIVMVASIVSGQTGFAVLVWLVGSAYLAS